ncbi:MAG: RNA polymerase sigma factor for flagellar operon FliA [Halieaceae bacterium]|jgi:RNA polymerase sigma factor for flagellar operon FliA
MNRLAPYSDDTMASADQMVREYLPLVKKIALRLVAKLPSDFELDDLMQVGLMGLLKARESYDAAQGASFSTYAGIRIKGAMLDEVRSSDWLPRSVQSNLSKVSGAIQRLEPRLGRPAQDREIAAELDLELADYQRLAGKLACARMTSLEVQESAGLESVALADPFENVGDDAFREALMEAVANLPQGESLMMSLYYSEELNLREIGLVLGVSESRVSQLHGQALARLRASLRSWVR